MKFFKNNSDYLKQVADNGLKQIRTTISRINAKKITKIVRDRTGRKVVSAKILSDIKHYAKERFGSKSYWPWLVLYTEIRGEFIPGWIPLDYYRFHILKQINQEVAIHVSEVKSLDYQYFSDFAVKPLFSRIQSNYYSAESELLSVNEIRKILHEHDNEIVIKEAYGFQGSQITFIHSNDFTTELAGHKKNYIVQPALKQHEILHAVHPGSVNTIRVNTFLEDNGTPVVKFAYLRFGTKGIRVDNVSKGGYLCFIDPSGNCAPWMYDQYGYRAGKEHPDTKVEFIKVRIPGYETLLQTCINSHRRFPYARFIAWDVAIDINGNPRLIEWNVHTPGFWKGEALKGPIWDQIPE